MLPKIVDKIEREWPIDCVNIVRIAHIRLFSCNAVQLADDRFGEFIHECIKLVPIGLSMKLVKHKDGRCSLFS